jgi:hypothetical protein
MYRDDIRDNGSHRDVCQSLFFVLEGHREAVLTLDVQLEAILHGPVIKTTSARHARLLFHFQGGITTTKATHVILLDE